MDWLNGPSVSASAAAGVKKPTKSYGSARHAATFTTTQLAPPTATAQPLLPRPANALRSALLDDEEEDCRAAPLPTTLSERLFSGAADAASLLQGAALLPPPPPPPPRRARAPAPQGPPGSLYCAQRQQRGRQRGAL